MSEKRLIVKSARVRPHKTIDCGGGSVSDRVVLPDPDGTNVKITIFQPKRGFRKDGMFYDVDESVAIMVGRVCVWQSADMSDKEELGPGTIYVVPAGAVYSLEALEYSVLVCVFSPVPDGPLPDNE